MPFCGRNKLLILISMATALILYQAHLHLESPGYFMIALIGMIGSFVVNSSVISCMLTIFCAMICASCFCLLLSVFGLVSDGMHLILNMMNYILKIFTGAEFQVSQLPVIGQVFSSALPLTRSIEALNLLFDDDTRGFAPLLIGELVMAIIYVIAAVSVLKYADRACRKAGKYDLF